MIFSWCWRVWQRGKRRCTYCKSDSDSSDSTSERSDYPCPFCHTDFINQGDVLSTLKSVQKQTKNLKCWSWSVLTASKPLKHMKKLRSTLEFTSWGRLETCIICLNNFNHQEVFTGHMNISSWTDFELPGQRLICPYCQQTFETNDKVEEHICIH